MHAVTLIQPVATLVVLGACRLEVRAWRTAHRGRVAVYASRAFPQSAREVCTREPVRSALRAALGHDDWRRLPLGALLGTVELIDCTPTEEDSRQGGWAWILGSPEPLAQPIPYRGCLGVFEVPDDLFQPEIEIRLTSRPA
jgi:hypothetical protein